SSTARPTSCYHPEFFATNDSSHLRALTPCVSHSYTARTPTTGRGDPHDHDHRASPDNRARSLGAADRLQHGAPDDRGARRAAPEGRGGAAGVEEGGCR